MRTNTNLILGSAQFGLNYGITNKTGIINNKNLCEILEFASKNNITTIDTSTQYGNSELNIGLASDKIHKYFRIVTKTRSFAGLSANESINLLNSDFCNSRKNLGRNSIEGLLFHNPKDLLSKKGLALYKEAQRLKGNIPKLNIGVSVYTPKEMIEITEKYPIDIIQIPMNIFDQRFKKHIINLSNKKIAVHIRSTFLQGLLLADSDTRKRKCKIPTNIWDLFEKTVNDLSITKMDFCLHYNACFCKNIIVGITTLNEFKEILTSLKIQRENKTLIEKSELFSSIPSSLTDPRFW